MTEVGSVLEKSLVCGRETGNGFQKRVASEEAGLTGKLESVWRWGKGVAMKRAREQLDGHSASVGSKNGIGY